MARLRTFLILLLLGAGLALSLSSGCMTDPVTGKRSLGLVNPTDEEEVLQGRQYAPSFVAEFDGVYPDPGAADHLSGIVRRIGSLSHRPDLPYRFTLLNSSVPNAFALPGGEVFMTRGLLARLGEESQFAVVMAHEIGHVNHRHSVKAMNDALVVGLGTTLLAGSLKDEREREVAAGLAAAGGGLLLLRFSRDQELEADDRGAEYAYGAGYDPRRGTKVFEEFARMKREAGGGGGLLESWVSSHPLDEDRVRHLEAEIARRWPSLRGNASAPGLTVSTPEWSALHARIAAAEESYAKLDRARSAAAKALAKGDGGEAQRALREVEAAGRTLPSHGLFPAVEGAILHALGDRRAARERLERALRLQPDLFLARMRLAVLENDEGRFEAGAAAARSAAELVPGSVEARLELGRSFEGAGHRPQAVAAYEAAARVAASGSAGEAAALKRLAVLAPEEYGPRKPKDGGRR
ncbi:MAG: M48 family metalloprotease [Planctomycetes bacterium]|nr:M48 family metalloprotease [Planctomycetota bacterium]